MCNPNFWVVNPPSSNIFTRLFCRIKKKRSDINVLFCDYNSVNSSTLLLPATQRETNTTTTASTATTTAAATIARAGSEAYAVV
ncbi:hypothetical protein GQ42DRAFT_68015 [Ramicandelaber brevisporus]|nr:hypothetical protein GQ42DRAFT_68015 [Ramicandelaber brevisporus]